MLIKLFKKIDNHQVEFQRKKENYPLRFYLFAEERHTNEFVNISTNLNIVHLKKSSSVYSVFFLAFRVFFASVGN